MGPILELWKVWSTPSLCLGTNYNTMALVWHQMCYCVLGSVTICNVIVWGTVLNVTISWHGTTVTISWLRWPTPIPAPNVKPLCTTMFVVPNLIIMIGLILVTAPNMVLQLSWYFYFGLILITAPKAGL